MTKLALIRTMGAGLTQLIGGSCVYLSVMRHIKTERV